MRTLQDELKRLNLVQTPKHKRKRKKKRRKAVSTVKEVKVTEVSKRATETLTHRDIEELMGVRRPRYTRKRGAIKQK